MKLFPMPKFDPLALVVALLVHVLVSTLWFNAPFLWSEQWLNAIGKTAEQVAQDFSLTKIVFAFI